MTNLNARNIQDCKKEITALSNDNPGKYITFFVDFGEAYYRVQNNLNVFAPSDSNCGVYALNGKLKSFTNSQRVADMNATPTMN
ncbi:MAG: hypothetical protein HN929_10345 [Chloroflexi bacterium]|jgi:hypothetical protein|nr:hypothetical protein [Chloroflexota bacterium]